MTSDSSQSRPRVVLGVSGGIAAYKACELLRRFTESGHDVTVVNRRIHAAGEELVELMRSGTS